MIYLLATQITENQLKWPESPYAQRILLALAEQPS